MILLTAESSIRIGEVVLNGLNPFEMADASEFPTASGADDKYEYYSLVMRIDKSRMHPHAPSAKSLEEESGSADETESSQPKSIILFSIFY